MGALRTRMIEEMKLRNFSPRTQECYLGAMVGLVKHYRRSPDELSQDEIRSYLLHLEKRGLSPSSRNVAISRDEVLLSSDAGVERQAIVYSAKKTKLAIARSVRAERSRAFAVGHGKAARPLSVNDGLRHRVTGERIGPAQSQRH
jgi:hypothetical protein